MSDDEIELRERVLAAEKAEKLLRKLEHHLTRANGIAWMTKNNKATRLIVGVAEHGEIIMIETQTQEVAERIGALLVEEAQALVDEARKGGK